MKTLTILLAVICLSCTETHQIEPVNIGVITSVYQAHDTDKTCRYTIGTIVPYEMPTRQVLDAACGLYHVGDTIRLR